MMWQGPHVKYKRPEDRKYSMWIKDSKDNHFLRERGMRCLADHEIGTHFVSLFKRTYTVKQICRHILQINLKFMTKFHFTTDLTII